ncbi:ABC-type multidrug transport system ATPase subunit [Salana multivorans]|uniref:ABC-type multidrug transport system ATPase subunit n=1 Tax=Salana multivorans TaxID=120377 RepID=A0A3N2D028_9MICO|nr:ABC transporter ATP-binding protein [Salana multivorans]MBN8881564.1 ABC transporter ATP-binding protein [Salana multivorans]OJX94761.1 MAG: ABC transporter [Micrococcales bacterium 73-15]ROR93121.1 ABC-type multidrug transport system ATPase subunit [Salana multivorans]
MAKSSPAVLRARDLLVGYGESADSAVCPPISVTIPPGAALAVVGANGSGKSTFLRAVVGLLPALGGTIELLGRAVDEREADFRAAVATVMDEDAAFPALTVREHLLLLARGHGVAQASELVTTLTREFGIAERERAMPTALSSGQRRRMLLAAAFVRPRRVLVLDEPEQRLDAGMRDRLGERLAAERRSGVTVVMATHDPVLVERVATHALVITDEQARQAKPRAALDLIETL